MRSLVESRSRTRELRAWRTRALLGVFLSATLMTLPALAAKPAPKPAPTCSSGALGTPTFAFLWNYQLYVGNADGSCALALAPVAQQYPLAFAFDGAKYRVFWMADTRDEVKLISRQRWTIKSVEFTMTNNGNISESRPLPVRELWRDDVTTSQSSLGIFGVNSLASQLVFVRTAGGVTELKRLDLASCSPTCAPATTLLTPLTDLYGAQFGRAGDDRLYYWRRSATYSSSTTEPIWWEIGFYENVNGPLSGPIVLVDSNHPRYQGTRGGSPRISQFLRGNFSADDLVAFGFVRVVGDATITDLLQVGEGCVQGLPDSCLASGEASIVAQEITGGDPFAFSAEWTPSGYLLRQVQASDGTKRIETLDPLSPTPPLVDHGIGFLPAGLKQ